MMIRVYSSLLIPVDDYDVPIYLTGTGHGAVDAAIMWALGVAGASSKCPPSPCKTPVGKGACSLVGGFVAN